MLKLNLFLIAKKFVFNLKNKRYIDRNHIKLLKNQGITQILFKKILEKIYNNRCKNLFKYSHN